MQAQLNFDLKKPDIEAVRAGNTGVPGVWRFESGQSGRHVMISALVHGNELAGAWALKGLLEAQVRPTRGSLTLAFCNLAAFDTFDPDVPDASRFLEQDLNRQWTDARIDAGATLEARRAAELRPFVQAADWLLDLHSMHEREQPLMLSGLLPRNIELAKQLGNPAHTIVDAGHHDGVRMRDYAQFGQPDEALGGRDVRSLLVECGFHGDLSSRDVARDLCVRFLVASGVVEQATLAEQLPGWRQPDGPEPVALRVTHAVAARGSDWRFAQDWQGLQVVPRAGTVLGYHGAGQDAEAVVTPYDDCTLVMPSTKQAMAGVTVVRLAQR